MNVENNMKIECPVEVIPSHVHLSFQDQEILFGKDYSFLYTQPLSQYGQWVATQESLFIEGPKGQQSIFVMGPNRLQTQVELTEADLKITGLCAPLRRSGDLSGSGSCVLKGHKGPLVLNEGLIVPEPHLHISVSEAKLYGWKNHDRISLTIIRPIEIIISVIIRIHPSFTFTLHMTSDQISEHNNLVLNTFYPKWTIDLSSYV
ncbi:hypothetical protein CO172_00875 [Candidatus Uhrbacteria bacterium CG_4_9_14_3_um_filter_36_7]|uniref:Phosphate propanoyltransferase n=1 Tax=Candidatus Uhrbacteria bacterium CG_4_9_14_3_um_filter_36_7 TaxID=1975033 RepID=A0A2M7XI29_9BACT|nr:MAG: hypothetical protein CO172_00875 [Candidatus Uhrbacteria bacterium CG_4_9_14_3_um_filter_36_7]